MAPTLVHSQSRLSPKTTIMGVTPKPSLVLRIISSFKPASCDLTLWNLKPSLVLWNDLLILMMSCFMKSQSSFHREVLVIFESSKCWSQVFLKIVPFEAKFSWALRSCSCLDWLQKYLIWKEECIEERKGKISLST